MPHKVKSNNSSKSGSSKKLPRSCSSRCRKICRSSRCRDRCKRRCQVLKLQRECQLGCRALSKSGERKACLEICKQLLLQGANTNVNAKSHSRPRSRSSASDKKGPSREASPVGLGGPLGNISSLVGSASGRNSGDGDSGSGNGVGSNNNTVRRRRSTSQDFNQLNKLERGIENVVNNLVSQINEQKVSLARTRRMQQKMNQLQEREIRNEITALIKSIANLENTLMGLLEQLLGNRPVRANGLAGGGKSRKTKDTSAELQGLIEEVLKQNKNSKSYKIGRGGGKHSDKMQPGGGRGHRGALGGLFRNFSGSLSSSLSIKPVVPRRRLAAGRRLPLKRGRRHAPVEVVQNELIAPPRPGPRRLVLRESSYGLGKFVARRSSSHVVARRRHLHRYRHRSHRGSWSWRYPVRRRFCSSGCLRNVLGWSGRHPCNRRKRWGRLRPLRRGSIRRERALLPARRLAVGPPKAVARVRRPFPLGARRLGERISRRLHRRRGSRRGTSRTGRSNSSFFGGSREFSDNFTGYDNYVGDQYTPFYA